jgi:hypothetical protein
LTGHLSGVEPIEWHRAYAPQCSPEDLTLCPQAIRIIHEDMSTDRLATVQQWMDSAEVIAFIGFGYHDMNLERLQTG